MQLIKTISISTLCNFLVSAKKNSYAGGNARIASKNILSKNYLYEEHDFRYEDQYYGEFVDIGHETVWYQNVPIWGMTYRGGIHRKYLAQRNTVFTFLKEALSHPSSHLPIRGPDAYCNAEYCYYNFPEGNILAFHGKETIIKNEIEICFRSYLGGLIYGNLNYDMEIVD